MAHEYAKQSRTLPAAADLSASQYCFVTIDSAGRAALAAAGGDNAVGVLQNKPGAVDREAAVTYGGTTKCKAGGVINPGDLVSCDSSGRAVAVTTGEDALGRAVDGAGAANQLFSCLLLIG
jgi:hypothetical protein